MIINSSKVQVNGLYSCLATHLTFMKFLHSMRATGVYWYWALGHTVHLVSCYFHGEQPRNDYHSQIWMMVLVEAGRLECRLGSQSCSELTYPIL